ncbi:MAG: ATP-grasp domain-containing protein [Chloroflexi bacterium]|nr:ATP-grasp domain-containing protein [Chloroflexota bacterium]
MTDEALPVLVLGVGGNVSQGILKALALSRLPTRVVGACVGPESMGLYTVDSAYVSPTARDPRFVAWLIETCKREGIRAVLTGVEPVVAAISARKGEIEAATGAVCLVSTPETLAIGDDKLKTCQWLEAHGLNTPKFAASEDATGMERLIREAGYPLIAKPRGGKSAEGILLLHNATDAAYIGTRTDYVVEEYLGDADSEYTVGCFVDRGGTVRGSIAMRRKLHQGTTVFAQAGDFPEVRAEAERIASALRPVASCNVQLRMHHGRPVAFEINVRFSGTTPMRARFGFNEVEAALRHYVLGEAVTLPRITEGTAVRYWNELYISQQAFDGLARDGKLDDPHAYPTTLEDYGI